jgi:hypothetical protein
MRTWEQYIEHAEAELEAGWECEIRDEARRHHDRALVYATLAVATVPLVKGYQAPRYEATPNGEQPQPLTVKLQLDGKKLAQAMVPDIRRALQRGAKTTWLRPPYDETETSEGES